MNKFFRIRSTLITIIIFIIATLFIKEFTIGNSKIEFTGKEIKIGLIAPLTGSSKSGGENMKKGVELAVSNINLNGGINGHKLTLVVCDDQGIPSQTEKAVKDLVFLENVEAIIGPFSSNCCLAIVGLVNSLEVPLITPIAMADNINHSNDFVFRNTLGSLAAQQKINAFIGDSQNDYILLEGFGAKSIGLLWQNDKWGQEMQQLVVDDLAYLGREESLLFSEPFNLGEKNFAKYFEKYKDQYPDLIYVVSSGSESNDIVKSGRDMGYQGLFYGEGGFNYEYFDRELKKYADGCLFSTQWHPTFSTPMSDVFLKSYMLTYDDEPNMFTAISYEAVYVLKDSLVRVEQYLHRDDFKEILQKDLAKPKRINGITGVISFDYFGQCDRPMFIMQKRWTGRRIQSIIIYPEKYSQGRIDFPLSLESLN